MTRLFPLLFFSWLLCIACSQEKATETTEAVKVEPAAQSAGAPAPDSVTELAETTEPCTIIPMPKGQKK